MRKDPDCPLCASAAMPFANVRDHFFGSPGSWEYWRCAATSCGIAFIAPAPTADQLAAAYSTYYTHADSSGATLPGWLEARLASSIRKSPRLMKRLPMVGWLAEQVAWELGGLQVRAGLVVDIGAGDGARLKRLHRAGWEQVAGVEPDPIAVRVAQSAGLDMRIGSAEELPLDDGVAQAALMHHVIEHVRDPRKSLAEAFRILCTGGELSIVTPNVDSSGRALWGEFWRGYEAPRHLGIFSTAAMANLAREAGFEIHYNETSARSAAWINEVSGKAAGAPAPEPGRMARLIRANQAYRAQLRERGNQGEEIVFVARKP